MYRIGTVGFLNTRPLMYGFTKVFSKHEIHIQFDTPSNLSKSFNDGHLDIALMPIVYKLNHPNIKLLPPYCIASTNHVASVGIFSECPLKEIETLYLDYRSNTSVLLCKFLLKSFWKINPILMNSIEGFELKIKNKVAALVIGDSALELFNKHPYYFDLASTWFLMTGLPFVFAGWFYEKELDPIFVEKFLYANSIGLNNLAEVISNIPPISYNLMTYFTENIEYKITSDHFKSIGLFLKNVSNF
ncbi:MAG: menaquinone biosynthesis protein [Alphaproteobacteria bacterium]|nr:menaquinone biosynthesis protein [Alphaproteobacteria bacterium]